jgi:site-specific recombinase XerD
MKNISVLYEFIDRAVRNRNYAANTAYGFKAALKRFEAAANEEEVASIEKFKAHLDQIYREVVTKNKDFTAESLAVYKTRVAKVINDYEQYGADPTKMASWVIKRSTPRAKRTVAESKSSHEVANNEQQELPVPSGMQKIEHPIRAGVKVVILLPSEVTVRDIEKVKKLLDLVEAKED